MTAIVTEENLKRNSLRFNEYYDTQDLHDDLFLSSRNGKKFTKLLELIVSESNILLAFRTMKTNKGSRTAGHNGHTIDYWKKRSSDELVQYIRSRFANYIPQKVRRVFIPKGEGKTRPLGIPTIEDRLIQQCIKQILEPICEAKFNNNSFGFRPNRRAEHAINTLSRFVNVSKMHYIVDIDIKGFFDNVNHAKLLKQLWNIGIRDKNLLSILSKMLKAEIIGEGIPDKGTPQGAILSPLLSNVVLNELDWWVSNQWETFKTQVKYSGVRKKSGLRDNNARYRAQRKTDLKECYIVRYADDFKIACQSYDNAKRMFIATKLWLKERLGLEVSKEKSKITNITKNSSEFLGFKLRAVPKGQRHVIHSWMSDKAKRNAIKKIRERIKDIQKYPSGETVGLYNSTVLGMQNYYRIATHVNLDMHDIAFRTFRSLLNRLKNCFNTTGTVSKTYKKFYKGNFKKRYVCNMTLFQIGDIQCRTPNGFNPKISNYTEEGRNLIHRNLKHYDMEIVHYIMRNPIPDRSAEYNDNRISLYIAQYGKCSVSGKILTVNDMECHHKLPISLGGTDSYNNLTIVCYDVHKLIHATKEETILKYSNRLNLDYKAWNKLNTLRKKAGNFEIKF